MTDILSGRFLVVKLIIYEKAEQQGRQLKLFCLAALLLLSFILIWFVC